VPQAKNFVLYSLAGLLAAVIITAAATARADTDPVTVQDSPATSVIINEVDSDTPSTDELEFVELYDGGTGNTPLDGLVVVFFNGNDDKSYLVFDLVGKSTNNEGYFVLGNISVANVGLVFPKNKLQNGPDAVALYIGSEQNFQNNTPITTTNLIDAISYGTDDSTDPGLLKLLNFGQSQVNENGEGDKDHHSNQRCPNGSGGQRNTDTYTQRTPTPGYANNCDPTAITLLDFTATPGSDGVTVTWQTGTEIDNAGFNLYRATDPAGPYTRVNPALIPAKGQAVSGAGYSYLDTAAVETGAIIYYKLEDIDTSGVSTFHGPVDTAPNTSAEPDGWRIFLPVIAKLTE